MWGFHSVTLEEPGPVCCCALPDVSMKCTVFIFTIVTKSVPSFQRSRRNIATIRRSNPKDLVPHYESMFAPNKIVQFCVNSSRWCAKGPAWRRYREACISDESSWILSLSTKAARSMDVFITALLLWEGQKLCERDPVKSKPHCLLSHTHTHL